MQRPVVRMSLQGGPKVIALMEGMPRELVSAETLRGIGTLAVRSVQRDIRAQRSPDGTAYRAISRFGQAGKRMIDTARLLNSIHFEVDISGMRVIVGTNIDYAVAQNFGGTWGPRRAKLMAVPLTRQVARAYVSGKSLRDQYPNAFVLKARTGNLFLAQKIDGRATGLPLKSINQETGKRSRAAATVELLFKLVDSVTIYGTHFLDRISDRGEEDIRLFIYGRMAKLSGGSGQQVIDV